MIETLPGATFTAVADDADPGLVGTIGVAIEDGDNNVISARTTVGIVESAPGIYAKDDLVAPSFVGTYLVIWDDGTNFASEELHVVGITAPAPVTGGFGPAGLMTRSCVIVRRSDSGTDDDYGDSVKTETLLETVCELQQQQRQEPPEQGEVSFTLWDVFFPANTDIRTGDAVIVDDGEYEVRGHPWHARLPRGPESHVEGTLVKTTDEDLS